MHIVHRIKIYVDALGVAHRLQYNTLHVYKYTYNIHYLIDIVLSGPISNNQFYIIYLNRTVSVSVGVFLPRKVVSTTRESERIKFFRFPRHRRLSVYTSSLYIIVAMDRCIRQAIFDQCYIVIIAQLQNRYTF